MIPEKFFDQFGEVLDTVNPLPGEEALYGQFRLLLDVAAKDAELKKLLIETAIETEEKIMHPFFEWKHNGRPAGNGWNRSTNDAQFGVDYFRHSTPSSCRAGLSCDIAATWRRHLSVTGYGLENH